MQNIAHDIPQLLAEQIKLLKQCYIDSQKKQKTAKNFLPELKKIAIDWLNIYRSQPDILTNLLFIKLTDQPFYIQKNIKLILLLLILCHKIKVHPALISPLLIAAICKDLIYLKILLKPAIQLNEQQIRQYKQKNPRLSSQLFKQYTHKSNQQQLIARLIKHQFETLNGKGPHQRFTHNLSFAEQIFSLCCLFVEELESMLTNKTYSPQTVIQSLCTHFYGAINQGLFDHLYASFSSSPLGSTAEDKHGQVVLINFFHQTRYACVSINTNDSLSTKNIREIAPQQLTSHDLAYVCSNSQALLQYLVDSASLLKDKRNYPFKAQAEICADITACPEILKIQKMAQIKQGLEINQLAKEIQQLPAIEHDLCMQAQQLSRKKRPISNLNQALMMLGLNRVPSWVVRNHLEKELLSLPHQQSNLCLEIMKICQFAAAELAQLSRLLLPEKAKLLLSYLLLPAMYNASLAITSRLSFSNSAFNAPELYQVSGEKYANLSFIIAKEWQESKSFIELTRQQLKQIDDIFTSKNEQKLLSLSMLSIHIAYSCFSTTLDKPNLENDKTIVKCLKLLDLKTNDFNEVTALTIHEINPFTPI